MTQETKLALGRWAAGVIIGALTMLVGLTSWKAGQDALPAKIEANRVEIRRVDLEVNKGAVERAKMGQNIEELMRIAKRIEDKLK